MLSHNEIEKIEILEKKLKIFQIQNCLQKSTISFMIAKYGTLPFAISRCAFISKSILDSLKSLNILSTSDLENFYLNIKTISKEIISDYLKSKNNRNFNLFFKKYGHLRPSTYSILTKNYQENHKKYFSDNIKNKRLKIKKKFFLKKNQLKEINNLFKNIILK